MMSGEGKGRVSLGREKKGVSDAPRSAGEALAVTASALELPKMEVAEPDSCLGK